MFNGIQFLLPNPDRRQKPAHISKYYCYLSLSFDTIKNIYGSCYKIWRRASKFWFVKTPSCLRDIVCISKDQVLRIKRPKGIMKNLTMDHSENIGLHGRKRPQYSSFINIIVLTRCNKPFIGTFWVAISSRTVNYFSNKSRRSFKENDIWREEHLNCEVSVSNRINVVQIILLVS